MIDEAERNEVVSAGHHLAPTPIEAPRVSPLLVPRNVSEPIGAPIELSVAKQFDSSRQLPIGVPVDGVVNSDRPVENSTSSNLPSADSNRTMTPLDNAQASTRPYVESIAVNTRELPAAPVGTGTPHRPLAGANEQGSFEQLEARLLRRIRSEQAAAQFRARANDID